VADAGYKAVSGYPYRLDRPERMALGTKGSVRRHKAGRTGRSEGPVLAGIADYPEIIGEPSPAVNRKSAKLGRIGRQCRHHGCARQAGRCHHKIAAVPGRCPSCFRGEQFDSDPFMAGLAKFLDRMNRIYRIGVHGFFSCKSCSSCPFCAPGASHLQSAPRRRLRDRFKYSVNRFMGSVSFQSVSPGGCP
jgi:hypothetical protein